jgi:hypothetical protein
MRAAKTLGYVVTALVALAAAAAVSLDVWIGLGDVAISWRGRLAMVVGILAMLALGMGLMALVFYSSRRGYDDADR